jgi:hypothetical protein
MKQTDIRVLSYLAHFFLEWEMFQGKVVEKLKTHILCSVTFFRKSCHLWDNVEKCGRAGQDIDDNMAHAHCMLDNKGYTPTRTHAHTRARTHAHTICNTCYFSPAPMVARTRLNVRVLPVLFWIVLWTKMKFDSLFLILNLLPYF